MHWTAPFDHTQGRADSLQDHSHLRAQQFCLTANKVRGTPGQARAGTIHELQRHASIWRPGSTKPVRLLAIGDEMHSTQHRGAQAGSSHTALDTFPPANGSAAVSPMGERGGVLVVPHATAAPG